MRRWRRPETALKQGAGAAKPQWERTARGRILGRCASRPPGRPKAAPSTRSWHQIATTSDRSTQPLGPTALAQG